MQNSAEPTLRAEKGSKGLSSLQATPRAENPTTLCLQQGARGVSTGEKGNPPGDLSLQGPHLPASMAPSVQWNPPGRNVGGQTNVAIYLPGSDHMLGARL